MALTWVKVVRPAGASGDSDDVYVNGQYVDAAGEIGVPFQVESGQNRFDTLGATGAPDWSKTANVQNPTSQQQPQLVVLARVAAAAGQP
jgi:hypothetical protein